MCTQTITVVDDTAPVITCPTDVTVECDASTAVADTGSATATDNCSTNITIASADASTAGTCDDESVISRTWTATDACGNSSVCTQTITVVDTTIPTITCPSDQTLECSDSTDPSSTGTATSTDNCDGTPGVTFTDSTSTNGLTRTWVAVDNCGNTNTCVQTLTVNDTTPPVITCPVDVTVECDASTETADTGVATATDNCSTNVTIASADTSTAGSCDDESTISRVWTATDNAGNSSTCTQTVTIVDDTAPVITCPVDVTVECDASTAPSGTGSATATDNCSTNITIASADASTPGSCDDEEVISRTWTATDDCGNSSVCTQTITVVDDTAPVITCPADATVECDASTAVADTGTATATDNCSTNITIASADASTAGTCDDEEVISRTWTATDDCGNSSVCTQTITVVDDTAPVITCPADATVNCEDSVASADTGTATATDNCSTNITIASADGVAAGTCPQEGVISRTWMATDECGNSSVCTQTITVVDDTAPVITCPSDVTVECDASTAVADTGSATATDNCSTNITIASADASTAGSCDDEEVISRTWTATDECGNSSVCTQTITVVDDTAPVITCPSDVTVECDASTAVADTGSATATDNCSTNITIASADASTAGSCDDEEVISRTWTATDDCGNSSVCTQTITVVDDTAPVITCPTDVTVECDASTAVADTGSATATDNCSTNITIASADASTAGTCDDESVISRTWTATDACGNSSVCTQTITVVDTTIPTITCPSDQTLECSDSTDPSSTGTATSTDNCDGTPGVTFTDSTSTNGLTRTWVAVDNCGNTNTCVQTLTVNDTTPPVITCPVDVTVECDASTETADTGVATATDNCSTNVTIASADTSTAGSCDDESTISRVWTATDNAGNSSTCTQTVTIVDDTAPVITCPVDVTVECDASTAPSGTGSATATDNCSTNITIASADASTPGSCDDEEVISRTWTATDDCGNSSVCTQTITVVDDTAPVITCPADATVECDASTAVADTGTATATDNCSTNITIASADASTAGTCDDEEVISRTWTATDDCGNSSVCTQTITVVDDTAPVITCPADATVNCEDSVASADTGTATATDNCSTNITIASADGVAAGTCPQEGVISRTWMATDECGNSSVCTQTITVVDDTAPVITCPSDVTVECDASTAVADTGSATATDNCSTNIAISSSDASVVGTCPQENVISREWTATDECGNSSVCTQTITVVDDTAPVITCPADVTVECDASTAAADTGNATATDNCSTNITIASADASTAGSCDDEEVISRTWTATDDCGNSSVCTQTITVVDDTAPVITCPTDVTVECDASTAVADTGSATATDNCSTNITIASADASTAGTCDDESVISRTWTATDACGNSSVCTQTITVVDTTIPTITCPSDQTLECSDSTDPSSTGTATSTDNCDGTPGVTFTDSTSTNGLTRTWVAVDNCGNTNTCVQTLTVNDTTPPVITCPVDVTVECDASTETADTGVATATDNCSTNVTIASADTSTAGSCDDESTISRVWTATDNAGNSSTCTQTVTIVDDTAPVITCPVDVTVECDASTAPSGTGSATATDNCSTNITIASADASTPGSCDDEEVISRTWTATDDCGNSSVCTQTITVVDDTAPVITCPADATVECDASTAVADTGTATATDNCSTNITIASADASTAGTCDDEEVISRTWTATDDCGNSSVCTQTITVVDDTAPVITCPADATVNCEDSVASADTGTATATDNCSTNITIASADGVAAGTCPQEGVISRTWMATDECGNSSVCTQTITVVDDTAPVITCPVDMTVECSASTAVADTGSATATDNCSTNIAISSSDASVVGTCPQENVISREWTATDECGNSSVCTQTITVVDTTAPVITCPADSTIDGDITCTAMLPDLAGVLVSDNCSATGDITVSQSPTNGTVVVGPTNVVITLTATDECGNTTNCLSTVTINCIGIPGIDITKAVDQSCVCDGDQLQFTITVVNTGEVALTSVAVSDAEYPACDRALGTLAISASTSYVCVVNAAGTTNTAIASGSGNGVTVSATNGVSWEIDETSPVFTCPADVTLECTDSTSPTNTAFATASDNCSTNVTITFSDILHVGACPQASAISRTWTATDDCGNFANCEQTIIILDTVAPVLTCPINVTLDCDDSTSPTNTVAGTATDNCDPSPLVTFSDVSVPGTCDNQETLMRTWTAIDACGNDTICTQFIDRIDTTAPAISCPSDMTLECDESTDPSNTGTATATNDCTGMLMIAFSDVTISNGLTRTWVAADGCGNTNTCAQTLVIEDSTPPTITCPGNVTLECDESTAAVDTGTPTAMDNCTMMPTITMDDNAVAGACVNESTITRVWTASDSAGNMAICTQTVTIVDSTPPDITCPVDVTIECDDSTASADTGVATATDTCPDTPTVTFTDVTTTGACANATTITRTWSAVDTCDNTNTCDQIITLEDGTAPALTCAPDITIECDESTSPTNTLMSVAVDNCDTNPVVAFADVVIPGACANEETIVRTWSAVDACGNSTDCDQFITVVDTTAPVITCPTNTLVQCDASTDPADTGEATATDNCDAAPAVNYVDGVSAGTCADESVILRTWISTDVCGNSSVCTQVITVVDTTDPTITCPANVTVQCDESTDPADTGEATATDNCDAAPAVTFADASVAGACGSASTISRSWTATDACGNDMVCTQLIEVVDTLAPTITCPVDVTVECDESTAPADVGTATAMDDCPGAPTVTFNDASTPGACADAEVITRTWSAVDACDNTNSCIQTITIVDTTAPSLTCAADVTIECDESTSPTNTLMSVAIDNCDTNPVVAFTDVVIPGACADAETIIRTWSTVDACGNSTDCDQFITVIDSVAPSLTCPISVTIECDDSTDPADTGEGTATDNCDATPDVTFSDVTAAGSCDDESVITREWSATDVCGNSSVCTQTLTLVDTTMPTITCPADMTLECDDSTDSTASGEPTVSDNCDPAPAVTFVDTTISNGISRTWTVVDRCGLTNTCVQTLVIDDLTPPVITCPADVTVECDESTAVADTGSATATDGCTPSPTITMLDNSTAGTCEDESVISRVWTATDDAGNSSVCTQAVTVVDSTAPVISCPADATLECTASAAPADTGMATATDNCSTNITVTMSDNSTVGSCEDESVLSRTWTATDACGNESVCTQTLTIVDLTAPVVTCPADMTVECSNSTAPADTGVATATDNCSTNITVTLSDVSTAGTCTDEKVIAREWTATDACGNSSVCTQTITVVDATAPDITCPVNVTVQCDESTDPADTGEATATDNCDAGPAVTFADASVAGACGSASTISRTWTATDACGNDMVCTQLIEVVDTVAPTITCPVDVTVECDASTAPVDVGTATATDDCPGTPTVTFTDASAPGACADAEVITRTWSAVDACDNTNTCVQTITIVDTTSPVLTCAADVTIECDESTSPTNTVESTAVDNCDTNPVVAFTDVVIPGACADAETIIRTWSTVDACGNSTDCDQFITVIDSVAPSLTCPISVTIECDDSTDPADTGAGTATDNCDAAPAVTFVDVTVAGTCDDESVITREWSATDVCGNSSVCTQTLTLVDTTMPTITCPADMTLECDDSTDPIDSGEPTVGDNCDPAPAVTFTDTTISNGISRTWTVVDRCGLTNTCVQTMVIDDLTPPVITCPADVTVECDESTDAADTGSATATDGCTPSPAITMSDNSAAGTCEDESVISRLWTATDDAGNSSVCTQTVTVVDSTPPVITCPADAMLECAESTATADTGMATATDNCSTNVTVTFSDSSTPGTCDEASVLTRTWMAADACGNESTCDQILSIVDTTAPVITCPSNRVVYANTNCAYTVENFASEVGVSDNCSTNSTIVQTPSAGSTLPEGTHTINVSVTDDCGNQSTCTFTLRVVCMRLGDQVWLDENNSGTLDGAEVGISNVVVQLFRTNDNPLVDSPIDTQVTDDNGFYLFTDLTPGDYIIYIPLSEFGSGAPLENLMSSTGNEPTPDPDDDINSDDNGDPDGNGGIISQAITLSLDGEPTDDGDFDANSNLTVDFGLFEFASIGDYVWYDDGDGLQGVTETNGVVGVTVYLLDNMGNRIATNMTDSSGFYEFTDLEPGDYEVEFDLTTLPAGYDPTTQGPAGSSDADDSDADTGTGRTEVTTLESGENDPTWDMGIVPQPASIGDYVWFDDDGSGTQDPGETNGVEDVTVYLLDDMGNRIATNVTDGTGFYEFTGLFPDDYEIEFDLSTLPGGYGATTQGPMGTNDVADSDADTITGRTEVTTLDPGEGDPTWDLGIVPLPASIGDYVWFDDGNGVQDPSETNGVPGVTVYLLDDMGNRIDTNVTDIAGFYEFTGLPPDDYEVEFDLTTIPMGYDPTTQGSFGVSDPTDSDADETTGRTEVTTLDPGESDPTWDMGIVPQLASIGDYVWYDNEGDGIQGPSDTNGVEDVTVYLLDDMGNRIATNVTDSAGFYEFTDLPPGDYEIEFDLTTIPGGYDPTLQGPAGTNDVADSDADVSTGRTEVTTLSPGENDPTWDFGITCTPFEIQCPPDVTVECDESTEIADTGNVSETTSCSCVLTITNSDSVVSGSCPEGMIISRTFTVSDACNVMTSCVQTITVVDSTAPVISCPVDITVECDESTALAVTGAATATDNCDTAPTITMDDSVQTTGCAQEQIITRTWTALDDCGNSAVCTQLITVVDDTAPVITCPADVTVECDESTAPANTGSATEVDNCDTNATLTFTDLVVPGACANEETIVRTWTVIDACGNESECDQFITVSDTTGPVITCPTNVIVECGNSTEPADAGGASATDNCDAAPALTFDDTSMPGSCGGDELISRVWTAADLCGNSSVCTQTISIVDTTPPVIACPTNTIVECDDSTDPVDAGEATASDRCDEAPAVTFADATTAGSCDQEWVITRTWMATDLCDNSAVCTQTISVVDSIAPVITCPVNTTVECTDSTDPADIGSASAVDNCDAVADISYSDSTQTGTCPQNSVITRTWTAVDDCGNQSMCEQLIELLDTEMPTIDCPADTIVECDASTEPASTGSATASDDCDTNVAVTYTDSETLGNCPQESVVTRTWTAVDDCGNQARCDQTITIQDSVAPVVTCPADMTVSCDDNVYPPDTGAATTTDRCDSQPSLTWSDSEVAGSCEGASVITRTWSSTDACGNTNSCDQIITVQDASAPELFCPQDLTLECDDSTAPADTGSAEALDNCSTQPTVTFSDESAPGSCTGEEVITRTWTATDDCGNEDTCEQVLTIVDTTAPVITCPADMTLECGDATDTGSTGVATATDNCGGTPNVTFSDNVIPGNCPQVMVLERVWTATDACGNASECNQLLVLEDNSAPTLTCPVAVTIECDASTAPADTGVATSVDNCDPSPFLTYSDLNVSGSCEGARMIRRAWITFDACGNRMECTQTLMLIDSTMPEITCPADVTLDCTDSTDAAETGSPVATDNCSSEVELTYSDAAQAGACPAEQVITRTWTATDDCGNENTCDQVILVADLEAPVIDCPVDVTVECDASTAPVDTGGADASDNCDGTPVVTFSDDATPGSCASEQVITRSWMATDACGLVSTCDQTIVVVDITPPTITCPANVTVECDESTDPADVGEPTASDNCTSTPDLTYSDEVVTGNCDQGMTIVRTWVAMDDCGNSADCVQVIAVQDTTYPVVTCPISVTVECDDSTDPQDTGEPTVTDNCDDDPDVFFVDSVMAGSCGGEQRIARMWYVTDDCGNRTICTQILTLSDTTPPVIACPQDVSLDCDQTPDVINAGAPTATDNCSDPVDFTYSDAEVAGSCPGERIITRTWRGTDACGNEADCDQIITVTDINPPIITCPTDLTLECTADTSVAAIGSASAVDFCDASPSVTSSDSVSDGSCDQESVITRTWMAVDACGNTNTCDQTITLQDTQAPVIACPPDRTVECSDDTTPSALGSAIADDNCDTDVAPTFSDESTPGVCAGEEVVTRTWTATDDCGNSVDCEQIITVVDTTAPTVSCPEDITINGVEDCLYTLPDYAAAAVSSDACGDVTVTQTPAANGSIGAGVNTVTLTATDECGNETQCSFEITVICLKLGGVVWYDADDSGTMEVDENIISEVPVYLYPIGADPTVDLPMATTTTLPDGSYEFTGLGEGEYFVFIPPEGFDSGESLEGLVSSEGNAPTPDPDNDILGDDNGDPFAGGLTSQPVTLTVDDEPIDDGDDDPNSNLTVDFGVLELMSLGSLVWLDEDNSGDINGTESGIPGVEVQLFLAGADPSVDLPLKSVTTGPDGEYYFDDLYPGDYFIYIPPTEFGAGEPLYQLNSSTGNGVAPDPDVVEVDGDDNGDPDGNGGIITSVITLEAGNETIDDGDLDPNTNFGLDFGLSTLGSIGDTVWYDTNRDGLPNENLDTAGFNGVEVQLYQNGLLIDSTFTTTNGYYLFDNLLPGDYEVVVNTDSLPNPFSTYIETTDLTHSVSLDPGEFFDTADFGFIDRTPTLVFMVYSAVIATADGNLVEWETGVESQSLGFFVYRANTVDGDRVNVGDFVPSSGNASGGTYELLDDTGVPGQAYYYWIVEYDWDLFTTEYGPLSVDP